MPYMLSKDKKCVHKKNSDGTEGELVKCHDSEKKAKAHLAALNINVVAAGKFAQEFVPGYKAITDAPDLRDSSQHHCGNCNFYKYMLSDFYEEEQKGVCNKFAFLTMYNWVCDDWAEFTLQEAAKFFLRPMAVKIAGDWELDVLAIPFGMDDEGQVFDNTTDIMEDSFNTPAVMYQHSMKSGAESLLRSNVMPFDENPTPIGKPIPGSLEKRHDGWHIRILLDKTKEIASKLMDAAKRGAIGVSSGTIDYIARVKDSAGRILPYDKSIKGLITVWPFAEISLWELGNGNFSPASRRAYAVPAMKAIYEKAGLSFPVLNNVAEVSEETRILLDELHSKTEEIESFNKYLNE